MTRVFLADAHPDESSALRLMLMDLNMSVVGESTNWAEAMSELPNTLPDILVVDFGLLPAEAAKALFDLSVACPKAMVITLVGKEQEDRQAVVSKVAGMVISRDAAPEQVINWLQIAACRIASNENMD
jgi:DNA-binding NarL/FixJ family response regulator